MKKITALLFILIFCPLVAEAGSDDVVLPVIKKQELQLHPVDKKQSKKLL